MRKDMKHVIIDRPRTGGDGGKSHPPKGSKKRLQKTPLEDHVKYESSARRRVYGYDCKQLNEHLSPLRRWLRTQVGRDWDEVWSEICEGLSVRNATTAHVRDHADQYVEKDCIIIDGKVCDSRGMEINSGYRWKQFYVDPRNNTLQVAPDYRRWRGSRKKKEWVPGKDDDHRYYLLKGVWYEVEFKPFPGTRVLDRWDARRWHGAGVVNYHRVHDLVIAATWERDDGKKYTGSSEQDCKSRYGRYVYAATKRQLGKREIHKLKLWESEIGQDYREAA